MQDTASFKVLQEDKIFDAAIVKTIFDLSSTSILGKKENKKFIAYIHRKARYSPLHSKCWRYHQTLA